MSSIYSRNKTEEGHSSEIKEVFAWWNVGGKKEHRQNEKREKPTLASWVVIFQKYGKFWSVSQDNLISHLDFLKSELAKYNKYIL